MGANELQNLPEFALNISRWGNSLAVRLPAALVRDLGVAEGGVLHVRPGVGNLWQMSPERHTAKISKEELIARLRKHLLSMPRTKSVIAEVRSGSRY